MSNKLIDGVLDFTFMDISTENDFRHRLEDYFNPHHHHSHENHSSEESKNTFHESNSKKSTGSDHSNKLRTFKHEIKAVRLSNNSIKSIDILRILPNYLDTNKILWLDLSFNQITSLSETILNLFPNLTSIYLQSNLITKLSDLKKLGLLTYLKYLVVYGNPVEGNKHYKNYSLFACKHLIQFDKSTITKLQASQADIWAQTYRKKLFPSEEDL